MLYLLAAILILIALLAASVRLAVFYSEDYSERLASLVSSYVGSPVEIGEVDLVWNRFDASASLKDIQIQSADGSETVLELPKIELQLNVRDMLLERNLSVRSVQLNNLSLVVSYEGRGRLQMLGKGLVEQTLNDKATDDPGSVGDMVATDATIAQGAADSDISGRGYSVLNWLFNAERISILDSDITLTDSTRDREYKVDNVNIRAFNDGDLHQIRVSSALPGEIGQASLASFDFTGKADDISAWNGQFYVNTSGLNLDRLSEILRHPSQQLGGTTDLQLWGKWSGTRINEVRAVASGRDIELRNVNAAYNANLNASSVNVDLDWLRTELGWQLNFSRLTAVLDSDDVRLDGLDLHVERRSDGNKHFRVSGPDIDLQSLRPVYAYVDAILPADAPIKSQVLRRGLLKNWLVGGKTVAGKQELTELSVEASDLSVDPYGELPGFSDLSAVVSYRDNAGELMIQNQDVSLSLPKMYEQPLPVINADGVIRFLRSQKDTTDQFPDGQGADSPAGPLWKVVTEDFRLSSLDLNTSLTFSLQGNRDGARPVDLHANILNANLSHLKNYFPTRVMKPKLLAWLQASLIEGDVVRGRVEVKGDLSNYLPAEGIGHFYAETDVVNTTLKFKPDWPAVKNMDGNLSFSAAAMRGRVYQGSFREAKFSDARLFIADFRAPILELQTNAIGPLADMLDFVQTGPMAAKIGRAFGDATGNGTSRVALNLDIPLKKKLRDSLAFNGEILLDNAQINARRFGVNLESATGKVRFNRNGILVDDLLVRYQGLPLAVSAIQKSNSGKQTNRLTIEGPMAVSSVMQSYGLPLVDQFEGVSDWKIDIDTTRRGKGQKARVEFTATSDLSGTEFKFPIPLTKSADNLHEVRLYRDFAALEKDWWVELPGLVQARIRVGDDSKVESMAIALGKSNNTVLPWRGIALHGDAQRVDALGWLKLALSFQSDSQSKGEAFPLFAKVTGQQMVIGDQALDEMVYIAYRDGTHQVHRLENPLVSGEVMLRRNPTSNEPLVVRLDRLDKRLLTAVAAAEDDLARNGVTSRSYDPRDLPALDVTVKELKWDNWRLAKVAFRSQPSERGMHISALTAKQNAMRLSGSGRWDILSSSDGSSAHSTRLEMNASFDDFGQSISAVGGGNSFAEGLGEAGLSLSWPGPGYAPDLEAMSGQLLFNLRDGRILGVEPGAGRILGLFALQALPRRLTLDFRDITKTGLEYTSLSGNLSIANGEARTNAIAVTGPVAEILIHGSTDFIARTYDQTIDVLPRISGALPLLGVLSGGPAAGITALLADGILRGIGVNLDEIGRRQYTLTGDWDSPQWQTVKLATPAVTNSTGGR